MARITRSSITFNLRALLMVVLLVVRPSVSNAQVSDETLRRLAEQLAQRRTLLETLAGELEQKKADFNLRLQSLSAQRADMETRIKGEEIRLARIEEDIAAYQGAMDASRDLGKTLRPLLTRILPQTRRYIRSGIPFQAEGRLAELDELARLAAAGGLGPLSALSRLWNMLDSEIRLGEEVGLYRQTIELQGEAKLAEVARLGMVLLYFKTLDGAHGYAVPSAGGWIYLEARDGEQRRQIAELFDSLRKNLRRGYFDLPNPLGNR